MFSIPVSVLKITSPCEGVETASLSNLVIRGGRNPLLEDFTSNIAELSGALASVLILTWLNDNIAGNNRNIPSKKETHEIAFIGRG
jgi:hypothetical protein